MRAILLLLILAVPTVAQHADAVLVDQFTSVPCEDFRGRLDTYFAELSNTPGWTGVIIGFEGKYYNYLADKSVLPIEGELNSRVQWIRNHISFRNFDPKRIIFVSGGFRDDHQFEFYKVPPGGKFPFVKPTLDSIKFRRGKPTPLTGC